MSGGMENLLTGAVVKGLYPVCDYWQLVTDAPIVTIYNPFRVLDGGQGAPPAGIWPPVRAADHGGGVPGGGILPPHPGARRRAVHLPPPPGLYLPGGGLSLQFQRRTVCGFLIRDAKRAAGIAGGPRLFHSICTWLWMCSEQ